MNLMPPPEAPAILRAGAIALLVLHVAGGSAGIVFGWSAMLARKGGRLHQVAGTVFFVAMLAMAGVGAGVSPFLPDAKWTNTTAAVFTLYLVATGWAAVQRRPGAVGAFEKGAVAVPLGIAMMGTALAVANAGGPQLAGFATVFAFAAFSVVAAACDLAMIRRGGLVGRPRIARHLWRMGTALFVANGSFFLGQQKFLPEALRGTFLPAIPVLGVIALTLWWLARTLRGPRQRLAPRTA
jgi:hypothetical protein